MHIYIVGDSQLTGTAHKRAHALHTRAHACVGDSQLRRMTVSALEAAGIGALN